MEKIWYNGKVICHENILHVLQKCRLTFVTLLGRLSSNPLLFSALHSKTHCNFSGNSSDKRQKSFTVTVSLVLVQWCVSRVDLHSFVYWTNPGSSHSVWDVPTQPGCNIWPGLPLSVTSTVDREHHSCQLACTTHAHIYRDHRKLFNHVFVTHTTHLPSALSIC